MKKTDMQEIAANIGVDKGVNEITIKELIRYVATHDCKTFKKELRYRALCSTVVMYEDKTLTVVNEVIDELVSYMDLMAAQKLYRIVSGLVYYDNARTFINYLSTF